MSFHPDNDPKQQMPVSTERRLLSKKKSMTSKPPAVQHLSRHNGYNYRYDYDVGYLIKSPCRECELMATLPACMPECNLLESIQAVLATTLSSCQRS